MLDLNHHVAIKRAIQRAEVVIAGARAIGLQVIPVKMIVVDKAAVEDHSTMRPERTRNRVCSLRRSAAVFRGPNPPFGIRLDSEAGKVGDDFVNLIRFLPPPQGDRRVGWIEGMQMPYRLRA